MAVKKLTQSIYYGDLGEPLSDFLSTQELAAIKLLSNNLGFDPTLSGQFYESIVSRIIGGSTTSHKAPHDVELDTGTEIITIEVKGSSAWRANLSWQGRDYSRDVFRFDIRRNSTKADFIVLMGLHENILYSWVIPQCAAGPGYVTICAPWSRLTTGKNAHHAGYACPPSQILDAINCWKYRGFEAIAEDLNEQFREETKAANAANAVRAYHRKKAKALAKILPIFG